MSYKRPNHRRNVPLSLLLICGTVLIAHGHGWHPIVGGLLLGWYVAATGDE
jgi:hypothetical protein